MTQGKVHFFEHDEEYWRKLRRDFAVITHEFSGAYCLGITAKPMPNFLENARKYTAIHLGLQQRSRHMIVKGEPEFLAGGGFKDE